MKEYSRYERQMVLKEIGREGQRRLDKSTVAVIGLGALGSVSANLLARAGVGKLIVIDRDFLEMNNLQRQVLYDESDLKNNLPKAVAAERHLKQVNSEIQIFSKVADISPQTIGSLLEGVDLIVDGTDNFETRFLLNDYALAHSIPWVYGGAVQTEGMSYVVLPTIGPCLRCLFGEAPSPENTQTCDQVGILAPAAHLIASFQATEAIKILAGRFDVVENKLWKIDIWSRQFKAISVEHLEDKNCTSCKQQEYPYLNRKSGSRAVTLCGRNSVQIYDPENPQINLSALAGKLQKEGNVKINDYLLKYQVEPYEITVFQNGRAIIKGTEDIAQAKSLYAKHIGA